MPRPRPAVFLLLSAALALSACAGPRPSADPLADIRNEGLSESRRIAALETLWEQVEAGTIDRRAIREDLKTMAWSPAWPTAIRLAALGAIASDQMGLTDTHGMVRLMLPRESQPQVTAFLSRVAAAHQWQDVTPALIRSLARPWPGVRDRERPEYAALEALNPGREVAELAAALFLAPEVEASPRGVTAERIRSDAWDLLARLDRDGVHRAAIILEGEAGSGPVGDMQALLRDMRTLPLNGEEIRWLGWLRDFNDPVRSRWWSSTRGIIAELEEQQTGRLYMRHLEPVRWAAGHRPAWMAMSRDELLAEVASRVQGRQFHRRSPRAGEPRPSPDRLSDWQDHLSWGDLLTILVIDEALQQSGVVASLFTQTEQDRRDRGAEYGGLLRASSRGEPDGLGGPQFNAILYPPRVGDRRGDHQFIAPADMIEQSYHALAHYHFHVQHVRNHEFAGPSPADMAYAARFGRACLVFTSVGPSALNVDYYQPDGVVLDMGTIRKP
jgi:hypothetical protein